MKKHQIIAIILGITLSSFSLLPVILAVKRYNKLSTLADPRLSGIFIYPIIGLSISAIIIFLAFLQEKEPFRTPNLNFREIIPKSFPKIINHTNFAYWIFVTLGCLFFGIYFLIQFHDDLRLGMAMISASLMSFGGIFHLDEIFEIKKEHKKIGYVISGVGALCLFFFLY